ncbi:DMT family transporter [Brenneria populi]|uniref:DMT family transporter n=1 Tax=Brenneria populi TaxID=1505588 RepID=A0ABU6JU24_9GAMM|nr:DMT family transporter [Brenneria populi Li et al. 2015]
MTKFASVSWDHRRSHILAILLAVISSLLYVIGYSLSKTLVTSYGLSAMQVTFLRCGLVLAGGIALTCISSTDVTWRRIWLPVRPLEQRATAAALVASNILSIVSYSLIQVTDASAIGFTAPILITIMGGAFLGERVPLIGWLGIAMGFAGMLLIVKPGGADALSFAGVVAGGCAALMYALYQIMIRRLRNDATSVDTALQVSVVGFFVLIFTLPWMWHALSPAGLLVAAVFTIVQTAAMVSIAAALRLGEASRLAPWQFCGLVWAMILDTLVFNAMPAMTSIIGGILILGGGLLGQRR